MKKALITGGMGYIGSHTVVELHEAGYDIVIVDNLSNSRLFILNHLEKICKKKITFYELDLCDLEKVEALFVTEKHFDVVVHFAAYKAVGESVEQPLKYYQNNLTSLTNVLVCMEKYACQNIVFSSSCTVYGFPKQLPVTEETPFQKALSAYGSTKQMGEDILEKVVYNKKIKVIALRYFNPVGAHHSALIGELPLGKPNNLMPFITQTAIGKQGQLNVWGNDYDTPDGSCIRDYIHVVDLAKAHVKSCDRMLQKNTNDDFEVFNVGTGKGISVLEMIHIFEQENKVKINFKIANRRDGDAIVMYADTIKANSILGWKAEKNLSDMVIDSWRWEQNVASFLTTV